MTNWSDIPSVPLIGVASPGTLWCDNQKEAIMADILFLFSKQFGQLLFI